MKNIFLIVLVVIISSFTYRVNEEASVTGSIVIIVNKDNPVKDLSPSEVKLYWLRKIKKRWPEINKNIKPVDRKGSSPEQDAFYKKVLSMSAGDVEAYFTQKQYENAEKPQDKFTSDKAILDFVNDEVGAIGFISSATPVTGNVKVVCTIP